MDLTLVREVLKVRDTDKNKEVGPSLLSTKASSLKSDFEQIHLLVHSLFSEYIHNNPFCKALCRILEAQIQKGSEQSGSWENVHTWLF